MKQTGLFLHYGPGGNAQIEKLLLAEKNPQIEFWDQPATDTFHELAVHVAEKLLQLAGPQQQKIALLSHSFSCELVQYLLKNHAQLIEEVVLYSPCHRLPEGFFNFGKKLLGDALTPAEVKNDLQNLIDRLSSANKKISTQNMWEIITLIVRDPQYHRFYLKNEKTVPVYLEAAAQALPMNFPVWQKILNDFLEQNIAPAIVTTTPVTIYLGEDDPYYDIESEIQFLRAIYPQSTINVVKNAAHQVHLESTDELRLLNL